MPLMLVLARTAQMILQYHRAAPFGFPNEKLIFRWKMVDWMHRLWTLWRTSGLQQKLVEPADSDKAFFHRWYLALQQALSWISKLSSRCPPRFSPSVLAQ